MSAEQDKRREAEEWLSQVDYDNDTTPDGWPPQVERNAEELRQKIEAESGPVIITRKPPANRPILPPEVWPVPPKEFRP